MANAFDRARFGNLARELSLGHPLTWTETTGSTNDDALAAAREGTPHGALFVTEAQAAGRGRRGNAWLATPGRGLLFSLVLRPNVTVERAPALALLAGLAVREVVQAAFYTYRVNAKALVKWPNDVVVADRKIAGVLVESQVRGETLGAVVVGVGLNVGRMDLPRDVAELATSLAALGVASDREELLAAILRAIDVRLRLLEDPETPLKSLVSELNREDALNGRRLTVDGRTGVGSGIDEMGYLRVTGDDGKESRVASGHVSFWDSLRARGAEIESG
jgi:BirA family transcriptional regulator, biotin operon repressor / biotin---[acetyl-CoA-carboxylase] ligase